MDLDELSKEPLVDHLRPAEIVEDHAGADELTADGVVDELDGTADVGALAPLLTERDKVSVAFHSIYIIRFYFVSNSQINSDVGLQMICEGFLPVSALSSRMLL
jgi:hypothetical protein